jgi:hypothetical protein
MINKSVISVTHLRLCTKQQEFHLNERLAHVESTKYNALFAYGHTKLIFEEYPDDNKIMMKREKSIYTHTLKRKKKKLTML